MRTRGTIKAGHFDQLTKSQAPVIGRNDLWEIGAKAGFGQ
jgi:hypothetical protein